MADRTTKVTLTASVGQYISEMQKASKATSETASSAQKLAAQAEGFQALGKASLAVGTMAAVGIGLAVAKFAEFDQAMSNIQAATHESAAGMAALRGAALEAGASTVFSATEAANAIEELAKAGVSTADILNGALDGALALAAAGGIGVAQAAEIASQALNQFNLEGSETGHVADLLAAGAGKASGDVDDLGQALNQAGLVANSTGLSIDETTAALASFASAGLQGSDAGTSLKSMLQRLNPQSAEAAKLIDELNLSAYDASGNFIGLEAFAGKLEKGLSGLSVESRNAALSTIYGSDAVRAATVLYNEGADGVAEWTEKVNDQGYAAETARIRLDNLKGDVEKLGGAFDTLLIQSGSGLNDSLRALTQGATGLVDAIAGLPAPVLNAATGLAGIVATVGLVGGAAVLAVPKIAEFRTAMATLNISGGGLARSLAGVTGALAVAGAAFAVWAQRNAEVVSMTNDLESSLDDATGAITDYTRETVARILADKGVFEVAKEAGIGQKELTDAVLEGGDALKKYREEIGAMNNVPNFFTGLGIKAGDAGLALDQLTEALPKAKENLKDQAAAADTSAGSTDTAAEAYLNASDQASELQSNLQSLIDTVNEANGVGQDAVSANAAYRDALAGVQETVAQAQAGVEGFSTSADESTVAGSENAAMFAELAAKSQSAAEAQYALDGDTKAYTASLAAGRQALYDQIYALTGNADAAQALTDKIYAMPSEKEIRILAETQAAQAALDRFVWSNDGRTITLKTQVQGARPSVGNDGGPGGFADGGLIPGLAGGSPTWWRDGVVSGPGGPRDDRVAAMLSPGEFVVNADATRRNLAALHAINGGYAMSGGTSVDMGPVVRQLMRVEQTMREVRDRTGTPVPMGAVQGELGAANVGNNTRGR